MPRPYAVEFDNLAIAVTTTDIVEILPATGKPVEICGWHLSQFSDVGDAQEEVIRVRWVRGNTSSGTGGTSITPRPLDATDAAAGFTAEYGNTTAASGGTAVNICTIGVNIRVPDPPWMPDGFGIWVNPAIICVLRLVGTPADSISLSGTVWVREYGG